MKNDSAKMIQASKVVKSQIPTKSPSPASLSKVSKGYTPCKAKVRPS